VQNLAQKTVSGEWTTQRLRHNFAIPCHGERLDFPVGRTALIRSNVPQHVLLESGRFCFLYDLTGSHENKFNDKYR